MNNFGIDAKLNAHRKNPRAIPREPILRGRLAHLCFYTASGTFPTVKRGTSNVCRCQKQTFESGTFLLFE